MACVAIKEKKKNDKPNKKVFNKYAFATPKNPYTNPPIAGPPTAPICQTVLFHVDELPNTFLGTTCDMMANIDGLINPRAKPVIKMRVKMGAAPNETNGVEL